MKSTNSRFLLTMFLNIFILKNNLFYFKYHLFRYPKTIHPLVYFSITTTSVYLPYSKGFSVVTTE